MEKVDPTRPYECGLDAAVDVMGGKWKVSLLWALAQRPCRFGELKRGVLGISEKMLIQQLRQMEADGLVERRAFPEIPPRVEYSLTELGMSLNAALEPLGAWGSEHMDRIAALRGRATPAGARQ